MSSSLGRRLNVKSAPIPLPSGEIVRHGNRLTRKTVPGDSTILEPKRHRSAQISHLEDLDPFSDAKDGLEVGAPPSQPLHSDADLINALSRDEIWEALNWPEGDPLAEIDDGDPFGNGFAMG